MSVKFELNFQDSEELEKLFLTMQERAETLTNQFFETTATKIAMEKITGFMPRSRANKKHAKDSNPLKAEMINLGFKITTKGGVNAKNGFGYLVFPDKGRGPKNRIAQDFSGKGLEASKEEIISGLIEVLDEALRG